VYFSPSAIQAGSVRSRCLFRRIFPASFSFRAFNSSNSRSTCVLPVHLSRRSLATGFTPRYFVYPHFPVLPLARIIVLFLLRIKRLGSFAENVVRQKVFPDFSGVASVETNLWSALYGPSRILFRLARPTCSVRPLSVLLRLHPFFSRSKCLARSPASFLGRSTFANRPTLFHFFEFPSRGACPVLRWRSSYFSRNDASLFPVSIGGISIFFSPSRARTYI